MIINNPNYEMIMTQDLPDIQSDGLVLRHKKSGASIALISNVDDNKVFYIGFRTPPFDSTGVPHIIEHSVLCGSDKYPVKDPFVELAKGSLNTFLNAMTYSDKTVYPVASCNDKDFNNLMDVYLDAVFHPNIYKYKEIFQQEGWHYELDNADDELTINGVVYNEMKGAFSSPDSVLDRQIFNSLFPDNAYGVESGGDPKNIPDLTYEEFLEFHQRYYHPCNSYIYLYGDMDFEERLDYLDKEYLSKYDSINLNSQIKLQKPFKKPKYITQEYPISAGEDEKDQTYLSYNVVVGDALNPDLGLAFEMLDYALLSSPGAPVREALLKAEVCQDVSGGYEDGIMQPMFSIVGKYSNPEKEEEFIKIIRDTLQEQVEEGINKESLLACANSTEFKIREADFGMYPKGLMYGLNMLDSWLYDKDQPFLYLDSLKILLSLKEKIGTSYFEDLVKKYLLDNKHASFVKAIPKKGLGTKEDEELKEKLAAFKATLSSQQIDELVENTAHLKEYQVTPSSSEDLAKIPMLTRDDLTKEARPLDLEVKDIGGITVLHHNIFTTDINYLRLYFNVDHVATEDIYYLSFLSNILGLVDTEEYSYADFSNKMRIELGGLSSMVSCQQRLDTDEMNLYFVVASRFVYTNLLEATHLIEQMTLHSDFSDSSRMRELVLEEKSKMESVMNGAGHVLAHTRAASHYSKSALLADMMNGIEYYRFIKNLSENYDSEYLNLQRKMIELTHAIFRKSNLLVSCTGDDKAYAQLHTYLPALARHLFTNNYRKSRRELVCVKGNEAFKNASKIQYVARSGNYKLAGFENSGYLSVLKTILAYDYLWINVRVTGGAYGAMSGFAPTGEAYMVSYRDPNLKDTNNVYEACPDYLKNLDIDEETLTKYVIGTISSMDTPLTPSQRGVRGATAYLVGRTFEDLQKKRDQVINATVDDIKALAPLVQAVLDQNYLCVIGNEDKIEENADMFDSIQQLF